MKTDCGTRAPGTDRLVVRPKRAWQMLDCGNTHGYELIAAGELVSFLEGRSRYITVESIHQYIARKIAAAGQAAPDLRRPVQRAHDATCENLRDRQSHRAALDPGTQIHEPESDRAFQLSQSCRPRRGRPRKYPVGTEVAT